MGFEVLDVPPDASDSTEPVGSKFKFWYVDENLGLSLFKEGRPGTGENWAEKAAAELAELIGLPHAKYELARWRDKEGVVTPTLVPEGGRLVLGNEILNSVQPTYDKALKYRQRDHTVRKVATVMRSQPYPGPKKPSKHMVSLSALDMFIGYIMFDVWIGNTDRHHENWGFINDPDRGIVLAPTFDHASSLGRELTDEAREKRLRTGDSRHSVLAYCHRGQSAFYRRPSDTAPLMLDQVFAQFGELVPASASEWLDRLENVSQSSVNDVMANFHRELMSKPSSDFAKALLRANKERLLGIRGRLA